MSKWRLFISRQNANAWTEQINAYVYNAQLKHYMSSRHLALQYLSLEPLNLNTVNIMTRFHACRSLFVSITIISSNNWTLSKVSAAMVLQQLQLACCAGAAPTRNTRISNKALTASAGAAAVWWPAFVGTRLLYLGNTTQHTLDTHYTLGNIRGGLYMMIMIMTQHSVSMSLSIRGFHVVVTIFTSNVESFSWLSDCGKSCFCGKILYPAYKEFSFKNNLGLWLYYTKKSNIIFWSY